MRKRQANKHLPPCVYHHHGAYWLVKRGKWTRLGDELRAALIEYARLVSSERKGTMPALIDEAMTAHMRTHKLAENTRKQYASVIRAAKEIFRDFSPQDVRRRDIMSMRDHYGPHPSTANQLLVVMRITFDYALNAEIVDADPTVRVRKLKEPPRTRALDMDEFWRIYAHADDRLQVIMQLCVLTGQRIRDVLKIRHADIVNGAIRFEQQKTGKRLVVSAPGLASVIERAKTLRGNVRALTLLSGGTGRAPNYETIGDQFRAAAAAAGVEDVRLHDLRALSAMLARKQGKDPQTLLGHDDARTTETYLRDRVEDVAEGPSISHGKENAG